MVAKFMQVEIFSYVSLVNYYETKLTDIRTVSVTELNITI